MASTRRALWLALTIAFRADRARATGVVVLSTLASFAGVLTAYWIKRIVDAVIAGDEAAVVIGAVGMGVTSGVALFSRAVVTRMQFPLKENTGLYLDRRIVAMTGAIPTVEHHERPAYIDRLEVLRREMPEVGFAGMHTAAALALLAQVTATAALLVSVNPLLLAIPLFAIPSLWAGSRAEGIRQRALDDTAQQTGRARHLFQLATSPAPGKELRVFSVGDELLRRHNSDWNDVDRRLDAAARRGLAWAAAGWLVFSAGYAGAIALVVAQAVSGRASLGDVVLTLGLVALVNGQVSMAAGTVSAFVRMVKVAERFVWLRHYASAAERVADQPAPAPERLVDGIVLREVSFRYPDTEIDVLTGVDLSIPAGSTVAVVGDNGAGKSTLVKLLCRFYEPSSGTISVDGTDLTRIDVVEWRARMSAGFQDFSRLELEAGETVGVGDLPRLHDMAAVHAALERAASSEIVAALPRGLATPLGPSFDKGVDLSGGQWQKLALGRAMMRPAPLLLVLDEPTAALDAETEHNLFARYASQASALAAASGTITLLVSHRFSTVRMADLIVVVDGGRVVATGTHDDLLARGGLYAELYDLHARAYR